MFIGHFGAGFAAKAAATRVSLGTLFLAAQFLDLLWPTLLLLGVERVRIDPHATGLNSLVFEHYPVSHSLAAVIAWALLVGLGYWLIRRERRGAIVLALLVISHWVLDAIVHRPDLPLCPGCTTLAGLNAWASLPLTLAIELAVFAAGLWLYVRSTAPVDVRGRWGLAGLVTLLVVIYLGSLFGDPPPDTRAIAWVGQMQWLLVLWGYWIDRHRRSAASPAGVVLRQG